MADSVGQIGLDLVVNQKGFNKQMQGISGLAKKAGVALAAAFAVKKIVDFGQQCIELGSDLNEVQNVVDVTFTKMSDKVNEFAKNAATSFGLSETMAKQYTGTFGAMAKAFGFTEGAAFDMSTTLTGLAGDVASFYNISQDEAYTKLKSVFTGETESLKDLGIVMTQNALDAYALANGYGKTTAKMSEAEKVALRYAFVTKQLSLASGDFVRTSDGWANQVRILNLQFSSFKATLGQGFINLFTPILKMINIVLGKLQTLADAFKRFTELITGKKAQSTSTGVGSVATDADAATTGLNGVTDAAKKAAKATNSLSIDELNVATPDDASGTGGAAASGADTGTLGLADQMADATEEAANKASTALNKIKTLCIQIGEAFQKGFTDQINKVDFSKITSGLKGIGSSLKNIFTDADVAAAAYNFMLTFANSLGTYYGSLVAIGANLATNLIVGLGNYLEQNTEFIQQKLISFFNIGSTFSELLNEVSTFLADLSSVLLSDSAISITTNLISIFANSFLNIIDLTGNFAVDFLDTIITPITANGSKIKEAIQNTLDPIAKIIESIKNAFDEIWNKIFDAYEEYVRPALDNLKEGLTDIVSTILDAYNNNIAPVLDKFADKFGTVIEDSIVPGIEKFIDGIGLLILKVSEIWNQYLAPFISWLIATIVPIITPIIAAVGDAILMFFETFGTIMGDIGQLLTDLATFLGSVFKGDWEKTWKAIKDFLSTIWDMIKTIVSTAFGAVKTVVSSILGAIKDLWDKIWTQIKEFVSGVFTSIKDGITEKITTIKDGLASSLDKIKEKWNEIWTGLKTTVTDIFNGIWTTIKGVINSILGGIEGMANGVVRGINKVVSAMNNLSFEIPDWVPSMGGKTFGFNIPSLSEISIPKLAQGGYVKANTPQLAMIGDNMHQGEIVAPEDKMLEMAMKAAELVNENKQDSIYLPIIIELLNKIISILDAFDLTLELDGKSLLKGLKETRKRIGFEF